MMDKLIARQYPSQEALDSAYDGISQMVARTDAHCIVFKAKVTEPEDQYVLVIAYDDDKELRRFKPGHWRGGTVTELPEDITAGFLAHANHALDEAGDEGDRSEHDFRDAPKRLTKEGYLVDSDYDTEEDN
jgi:hypothetical protein